MKKKIILDEFEQELENSLTDNFFKPSSDFSARKKALEKAAASGAEIRKTISIRIPQKNIAETKKIAASY